MDNGFGATKPYTVGVEEEFQLVDPVSRGLTPAVEEVLAAGEGSRLITSELSRSCVEMVWVARTQAIYGLHIHVAVPDGDAAILAVNTLARHVPLLVALSANSPFWRGFDTRLASTRIKIFEMFPRS